MKVSENSAHFQMLPSYSLRSKFGNFTASFSFFFVFFCFHEDNLFFGFYLFCSNCNLSKVIFSCINAVISFCSSSVFSFLSWNLYPVLLLVISSPDFSLQLHLLLFSFFLQSSFLSFLSLLSFLSFLFLFSFLSFSYVDVMS